MNATDKSNRMLRAKAMECISLVGMAVGKEKFRDDAKQVILFVISPLLVERRTTKKIIIKTGSGNHCISMTVGFWVGMVGAVGLAYVHV